MVVKIACIIMVSFKKSNELHAVNRQLFYPTGIRLRFTDYDVQSNTFKVNLVIAIAPYGIWIP